ncbi:hypothetical protein HFD88_008331 [Aspergillus terreus]|nr:hypothetical protein HFD88_008331 [Aspergillus terreus]
MTPLKILINGAGIASNALAFWLCRLGHNVTVLERAPKLRDTGLQVDLRGHGIEVLKLMGLEPAFKAKSIPERGLQIVDSSGRRRGHFPVNTSGKGPQSFSTEYEIMRGDLCRLFYEASQDRAKYVFGTSVKRFANMDDGVEVEFTNGLTDRFDLLVGADGQGSRTRRMMLGPGTHDGFYPLGGTFVAYFTIPRPIQDGEEYLATMYLAPGKRGIMTRRHSPHELQVYFGCVGNGEGIRDVRRGDVKKEKEILAEIFQGAGWETEELSRGMMDADDFYCERLGLVKLDAWTRGRVTLVGDAAYCPSAVTGMGTTSGIVGAYVLAGEIARHCGRPGQSALDGKKALVAALEAYEQRLQPFMAQVQKGVLEDPAGPFDNLFSTAFGIAIIHHLVGLASFFQINFGKWFLREEIHGWDLPDYEELHART